MGKLGHTGRAVSVTRLAPLRPVAIGHFADMVQGLVMRRFQPLPSGGGSVRSAGAGLSTAI